jgi:hypothetical protein
MWLLVGEIVLSIGAGLTTSPGDGEARRTQTIAPAP